MAPFVSPRSTTKVVVPRFANTVVRPRFATTIVVPRFANTVVSSRFATTVVVPRFAPFSPVVSPRFATMVVVPRFFEIYRVSWRPIATNCASLSLLYLLDFPPKYVFSSAKISDDVFSKFLNFTSNFTFLPLLLP